MPPRTAPRTHGTEQLRQRIRAEATRLIATHGYGAIAINDVATAVGISKQALLYHFPSKEALHAAVLEHLLDYASRTLPPLVATLISDEPRRLEQAFAQLGTLLDGEPHAAGVMLREMLDAEPATVARIRRGADPWLRLLLDWLARGQREGRIRADLDPESAVLVIATLVVATAALLPHGGFGNPRTARARRLKETVRTIERMLFVDEAEAAPAPAAPRKPRRRASRT